MARKVLGVQQTPEQKAQDGENLRYQLQKLIPEYGLNKSKADELKAVLDDGNKEIKRICKELSVDSMEVEGWTMSYKVVTKQSVNEDKMLDILKTYWSTHNGSMECPYIKKKEYVDIDALENEIFTGNLTDKDILLKIKNCYTDKQEERLTIKKAKEKKE